MRTLARFAPTSGQLSKVADMDREPIQDLEARCALFTHPPLTGGTLLYLSDRSGYVVYTYDSSKGFLSEKQLPDGPEKHRFIPHQSIIANNRIYSAHRSGLTVMGLELNRSLQTHLLTMTELASPEPVAKPISYGCKLYILCKDRLICRDY